MKILESKLKPVNATDSDMKEILSTCMSDFKKLDTAANITNAKKKFGNKNTLQKFQKCISI